jgi:hypothetical protein
MDKSGIATEISATFMPPDLNRTGAKKNVFYFFLDKKSNKKVKAKRIAPLVLPCPRTSSLTTGSISHYS